MEKLIEKARTQSTETILECLMIIGGGQVEVDSRMARAALLEVYKERTSDEELDLILDAMGM
jgi:hypothetical protein